MPNKLQLKMCKTWGKIINLKPSCCRNSFKNQIGVFEIDDERKVYDKLHIGYISV